MEAPPVPVPCLSVVVPAYNEQDCLRPLHARLSAVLAGLGESFELLFVDDGSRDATPAVLRALQEADPHLAVVRLSRNFGKEIATTAGLDHARGAAVIIIDADLQDPPELIPSLVARWREGHDMVLAQRRTRQGDGWFKRNAAALFYRLMRDLGEVPLPENVGDFRLLSRRAVDATLRLRERHRFMKGLFAWAGFPTATVLYDRAPRSAGRSKWSLRKLGSLAVEGITSFSILPLRLATWLGLAVALFAVVFGLQLLLRALLFGNKVAGYPSLMLAVLFLGSAQLITLGVIGEYVGRIFNETKHRPLYLVEEFMPAMAAAPVAAPQSEVVR